MRIDYRRAETAKDTAFAESYGAFALRARNALSRYYASVFSLPLSSC